MNKFDVAMYLVNLSTLLGAQDAAGGIQKSQTLLAEYNLYWAKLKEMIADETRPSEQ